jgi:RNA polymerase sigma-70 factor, ECF subfamily
MICLRSTRNSIGLLPAAIGGTLVQSFNATSASKVEREGILPIDMSETELNELFAYCIPKLKKTTRRMLRNQADWEDALQDGLLLAFRNLHQFQGRSAFLTWLHSIVRNSSRVHYRKAAAHPTVSLEPALADQSTPLPESQLMQMRPSPEETCIRRERSDILRTATRELPVKYRRAIKYFHLLGLGEIETARRLGMTNAALKSQLHRSRRILTHRIRQLHLPDVKACYLKPETRSASSVAVAKMP